MDEYGEAHNPATDDLDEQFKFKAMRIFEKFLPILVQKNHDYGDKNLVKNGLYGICVRLDDKVGRIKNIILTGQGKVADEPIEITLQDIIGYAIQALRLRQEKLI